MPTVVPLPGPSGKDQLLPGHDAVAPDLGFELGHDHDGDRRSGPAAWRWTTRCRRAGRRRWRGRRPSPPPERDRGWRGSPRFRSRAGPGRRARPPPPSRARPAGAARRRSAGSSARRPHTRRAWDAPGGDDGRARGWVRSTRARHHVGRRRAGAGRTGAGRTPGATTRRSGRDRRRVEGTGARARAISLDRRGARSNRCSSRPHHTTNRCSCQGGSGPGGPRRRCPWRHLGTRV